MGDAHVYLDHVEALETQLTREPRDFPELQIVREEGGSIDGWAVEDFVVKGYDPHKGIAMKMSVGKAYDVWQNTLETYRLWVLRQRADMDSNKHQSSSLRRRP
ncbi:Thymidylate synthase [Cryomyces antarcticus]|nr:Thymidylate synthase [Cryomyces antarcticus]